MIRYGVAKPVPNMAILLFCNILIIIFVASCEESETFPYQILKDNRESFSFNITDIDSLYYFAEYPDTPSIHEYAGNIADDILQQHNPKLEPNLFSSKEYSMFILFKNGKSNMIEYSPTGKSGIQFTMQCDFIKLYKGDMLEVKKKNVNSYNEYFITLNDKNHPYHDCFSFTNIGIDSSATE